MTFRKSALILRRYRRDTSKACGLGLSDKLFLQPTLIGSVSYRIMLKANGSSRHAVRLCSDSLVADLIAQHRQRTTSH